MSNAATGTQYCATAHTSAGYDALYRSFTSFAIVLHALRTDTLSELFWSASRSSLVHISTLQTAHRRGLIITPRLPSSTIQRPGTASARVHCPTPCPPRHTPRQQPAGRAWGGTAGGATAPAGPSSCTRATYRLPHDPPVITIDPILYIYGLCAHRRGPTWPRNGRVAAMQTLM